MSAPAFQAATTSVGVSAPGITGTPRRGSTRSSRGRAPGSRRSGRRPGCRRARSRRRAPCRRRRSDIGARSAGHLLDHAHGAGHGHRDLEDRDAARPDRVDGGERLVGRLRRGPPGYEPTSRILLSRMLPLAGLIAPPARRRPSSRAPPRRGSPCVVSPGVDMASAPCATPQSTAHCGPLPAEKPVDEPGGERVAAADAVEDLESSRVGALVELAVVRSSMAPQPLTRGRVAVRSVVATACEVREGRDHLLDHAAEVRRVERGEVLVERPRPRSRARR